MIGWLRNVRKPSSFAASSDAPAMILAGKNMDWRGDTKAEEVT